jgi:hypothetical protein
VTAAAGNRCKTQLGSLPLVLIPNFRGGNLIATAGAFENRLDEGPLLLEGVAGGEMESDVEMPYVRGISRSSYVSITSPGLRSWKSDSPMPHS